MHPFSITSPIPLILGFLVLLAGGLWLMASRRAQRDIARLCASEKNNAHLAAIVAYSDDAIISKALDGTILSWNPGAELLFGYGRQEAVGKNIRMVIPPDLLAEEEAIVTRLKANERISHLETMRLHKSGRRIDVSLTVSPICDEAGNVVGASKIIHDITERKRVEREIKESQERYRALVEATTQVIWVWKEGAIEQVSPLWRWWEATTGQPAADIATFGWLEVVHPDDRAGVQKIWSEAIAGGKDFAMSYRLRARDGTYAFVEVRGVAVLEADGSVREFVGSLSDVTEPRRAEQEIIDNAARLKSIFDTVIDALITLDAKAMIESFNTSAERLFGYSPDEAIGRNISMLLPGIYEGGPQEPASLIGAGREVTARRKGGSEFAAELGVSMFIAGREKAYVAGIRDITSRTEVERERHRYTAALERSNKELDDFAYIASHDLKEPLRGIHNHARFLLEDNAQKLDAESVSRLGRLTYLSQRMERLVNDLLYFSRLGRQELAVQPTDMNAVVRDIETTLDVFLAEHRGRILVPKELPTVTCDATRVTEVLRNLITNALKYNGSIAKTVEIGFHRKMEQGGHHERNVFYVRDNGKGIAAEFHENIFRIFKRLQSDTDPATEGTGVGLTFVKKIVERHGGRIWLESEPGKGTTFYFTLQGGANDIREAA